MECSRDSFFLHGSHRCPFLLHIVPELLARARRMSLEAFGVGEGSNTAARRRPRPPNFQQKERESERGEHGSLLARSSPLSDTGWVRARCLGLLFSDDID